MGGVFLADEISWSSHWLDAKIIPEWQIFKWTDDNGKLDRHMNNMRNKLRDRQTFGHRQNSRITVVKARGDIIC